MNAKLISASITLGLAVLVLLPYIVSAAAIIDLSPATATLEDAGVSSVETRFNETGKLLALMPVKLSVTVRVTPEGAIELGYPWYSALMVDRKEKLETELKVAADTALHSLVVGKVVAESSERPKQRFSSEEAAAVLAAVNRVLEENFGGEAP